MVRSYLQRKGGRDFQRGAGLVLIIGVVAALAVSAATLVALTANVQHNSADTQQSIQVLALLREAGLDAGMVMLSSSWPNTSTSIPTFNATAFRSRFSPSDSRTPRPGSSS